MPITSAAVKALAPGGRLEGDRVGSVRIAVERSADGRTLAWLRETLDGRGRVTSRQVTRTTRAGRPPIRFAPSPGVRRQTALSAESGLPDGTFGRVLRAKRSAAGLTPTELAEKAGVTLSTISGYEGGKREPIWGIVQKLADIFGCSLDDFRETAGKTPKKKKRGRPKGKKGGAS